MSEPVKFALNGQPVEIADAPPTTTLLDWLRYDRRLTGTKEGCAEGDCGACTVGLREIGADGALVTRPVCACIQLLPMCHGKEVVTVERLRGPDGALHPVQAAMAEGHGSQCGFCTPGFVMSLWTAYRTEDAPDTPRVNDLLAGNLCRCTGYGPIIAAAREAYAAPRPVWEEEDVAAAPARLRALRADGSLDYAVGGRRFLSPTGLSEFAALVAAHPEATILSGATDVGLWVTKRAFDPETVIWTGRVAELAEMREADGALWIGAAVSWRDAHRRLGALFPDFGELIRRFGGQQIRSAGTVGGNIANGSPIGDGPPALIAAGATLVLRHGAARREIPLEAFFIDYGEQDLRPGEFVEGARAPLPENGARLKCHKVSKRFDQDITAVLGCFDIAIENGEVASARLAFGGVAGVPKRAPTAEAALTGADWTLETVAAAAAALAEDFTPMTDMRASAGYRLKAARNLLIRHYHETTSPETLTRLAGAMAV